MRAEGLGVPRADRPMFAVAEASIAGSSFLLNLPWEVWQMPFYRCLERLSYSGAIRFCTLAAVGDAVISVAAFWAVSLAYGSRAWILRPTIGQIGGFVGTGLTITVGFEWLATEVLDRWQYAEAMPTLPVLGTGLLPLLQWTILPPLVLWLARRQLASEQGRWGGELG
jgi:hypothetical protein